MPFPKLIYLETLETKGDVSQPINNENAVMKYNMIIKTDLIFTYYSGFIIEDSIILK